MWRSRAVWFTGGALLAGLGGFFAGAQSHRWTQETPPEPGPVVARIGHAEIPASTLKARLEEFGPMARARLSTIEGRREVLEELIRTELLAEAARKGGHAQDPAVRRRLSEALAEVYLERELEPRRQAVEIPEAKVRAAFEAEKKRLSSPERVRLAQIFLHAPSEPAEKRAVRKREAEALLARVEKALASDFQAFAPLARATSEDPDSRPNGGELPPMTRQELEELLGPDAAQAALSAEQPGTLIPSVLESPAGFHVVRVLEHHPATEASYSSVSETLRIRLRQAEQQRVHDEFLAQLRAQSAVEIDEEVLRELQP